MNTDTMTSPGIGLLPSQFATLGGCIIDLLGVNGKRVTAQIAAGAMFRGWAAGFQPTSWPLDPLPNPWLLVGQSNFDGAAVADALGGGIAAANLRITLEDGDSGSPNPVYVAMFGSGNFPYLRATTQPGDYDFDGGENLAFGFADVDGNPVACGYMGACTTYRLDASGNTIGTFTGFPGVFALTDPLYSGVSRPAGYMTPVQAGQAPGVWPVTGWFSVPIDALPALFAAVETGTVHLGINDALSAGDQFYDFTAGLALDVIGIPFTPAPSFATLDLWVWRQLHKFEELTQDLNFPPGYEKALLYALAAEMFTEYPAAAKKFDLEELLAEAEDAVKDLEILNASDAVSMEPPV